MRAFTRRDALCGAALVVAFVASRVAWLRWNPGSASYWEESYRWVAALLWRAGEGGSFLDLQADHYQGGSLVMIALTAAIFRVLEPSVFALKLTALGFSTLTLALLFETVRRFFGTRAAALAAAAYVAGPPLVAYWGLVVMGSHGESVALSLLQILIFLGIVSGEWRNPRGFFAFGLASGLGLWFCYTAGLSALACAISWCVLERLPRPRELFSAALGGALGLLPWLVYNATHAFAGLDRVLQLFGLRPQIDPWPAQALLEKTTHLIAHVLPVGLLSPTSAGPVSGFPFAFTLAFAVVSVPALLDALARVASALRPRAGVDPARRARGRFELVFLVYPVVFLGVYLASRYAVDVSGTLGYRIFTPLAVLVSVPIAISLAEASRGSGAGALFARGACAVWLLSLATATVVFARGAPDDNAFVGEAIGYKTLGVLLHRKHAPDVTPSLAIARSLADSERSRDVRIGIGWGLQNRHEVGAPFSELEAALASVPEEEQDDVRTGIRWSVGLRLRALVLHRNLGGGGDSPLVHAQLERNEELAAFLAKDAPPAP
jgi:hypothetical protein